MENTYQKKKYTLHFVLNNVKAFWSNFHNLFISDLDQFWLELSLTLIFIVYFTMMVFRQSMCIAERKRALTLNSKEPNFLVAGKAFASVNLDLLRLARNLKLFSVDFPNKLNSTNSWLDFWLRLLGNLIF